MSNKIIARGLLPFLVSHQGTRKIFGKKELEIIAKQLKGMLLTQSERNRLSRDIRPKLAFIKDAAFHHNEFALTHGHENKELMEKAVRTILNDKLRDTIRAVLLFGSFADHTFTLRSDIDICVVFTASLSLREATRFRIRMLGQLPDRLDVQVFNILPQKIKREIASNHRVLYKSPGFDNVQFTTQYIKDKDYFMRMERVFGAAA